MENLLLLGWPTAIMEQKTAQHMSTYGMLLIKGIQLLGFQERKNSKLQMIEKFSENNK